MFFNYIYNASCYKYTVVNFILFHFTTFFICCVNIVDHHWINTDNGNVFARHS